MKNALSVINLILLLGIGIYLVTTRSAEKKGYVLNQKIFDGFKGKDELEKKLTTLQNAHRTQLDSLDRLIQRQPSSRDLIGQYQQMAQEFSLKQQELSQQFTSDIWKRINEYTAEYGKEKGYSFIFGASGDGSLMYASDANNITDDVLKYINQKYVGQ